VVQKVCVAQQPRQRISRHPDKKESHAIPTYQVKPISADTSTRRWIAADWVIEAEYIAQCSYSRQSGSQNLTGFEDVGRIGLVFTDGEKVAIAIADGLLSHGAADATLDPVFDAGQKS